jgi:Tol biopolymer transport system component
MNPDGSNRRQLTRSNGTQAGDLYGARTPTWAPDGSKLAFGYGYGGLYVVGSDGQGLRRLLASGLNPNWSPKGRKIAYVQGGETDPLVLYVVNPDGSGRQLVGRPPDYDQSYNTPICRRTVSGSRSRSDPRPIRATSIPTSGSSASTAVASPPSPTAATRSNRTGRRTGAGSSSPTGAPSAAAGGCRSWPC